MFFWYIKNAIYEKLSASSVTFPSKHIAAALTSSVIEQNKPMFNQRTSVLDYFKKPVDPKELVRKWQSDLRAEVRKTERSIMGRSLGAHQAPAKFS